MVGNAHTLRPTLLGRSSRGDTRLNKLNGEKENPGAPIPRLKRRAVDMPHTTRGLRSPVGRAQVLFLSLSSFFLFFLLCFGFAFSKFEKIEIEIKLEI
jgi:hypothetical protein